MWSQDKKKKRPAKHRLWQMADAGCTAVKALVLELQKVLSGPEKQIGSMGDILPSQ